MKRFINTDFFLTLQDISQNGTIVDSRLLKSIYDEFVVLILSESTKFQNHVAYRNALVYTVSELTVIGKEFQKKSH